MSSSLTYRPGTGLITFNLMPLSIIQRDTNNLTYEDELNVFESLLGWVFAWLGYPADSMITFSRFHDIAFVRIYGQTHAD